MKKVLITVIILLLAATAISYAQIFNQPEKETSGTTGSLFENTVSGSGEASTNNSGGFFRSGNPDDPGGRPGDGGGIGQDASINEGLYILIACCIALELVRNLKGKRRK
jgi:hypothetical protein